MSNRSSRISIRHTVACTAIFLLGLAGCDRRDAQPQTPTAPVTPSTAPNTTAPMPDTSSSAPMPPASGASR